MALYPFRLPDVGEGVAEAEIVAWHIAAGDAVREDQPLCDVMTDKATVEMTSPVDGVVRAIHGAIGAMVPVGHVLVEIAREGEAEEAAAAPVVPPVVVAEPVIDAPVVEITPALSAAAPMAAPATRARAHALGIDLAHVPATGPGGRVLPADLDAWIARRSVAAAAPVQALRDGVREERLIGLRRRIAERMELAARRIPHITYVEEADLTELEVLRHELNASRSGEQPKLTVLPLFLLALVRVLPQFPRFNARYDDEHGVLSVHEGLHLGIATQTPAGLMVPVIRHAETRDVWDLAREVVRLAAAARDGTALRDELSGSTITVTSLGALGGLVTTPIINHPEVAIVGPNRLVERPVVRGGQIVVRTMMTISSSFDHRVIDGHDAASFIQALRRRLEHPALLFV